MAKLGAHADDRIAALFGRRRVVIQRRPGASVAGASARIRVLPRRTVDRRVGDSTITSFIKIKNFKNLFPPLEKGGWGDLICYLVLQIPPRFAGLPFPKGEKFNLKLI